MVRKRSDIVCSELECSVYGCAVITEEFADSLVSLCVAVNTCGATRSRTCPWAAPAAAPPARPVQPAPQRSRPAPTPPSTSGCSNRRTRSAPASPRPQTTGAPRRSQRRPCMACDASAPSGYFCKLWFVPGPHRVARAAPRHARALKEKGCILGHAGSVVFHICFTGAYVP